MARIRSIKPEFFSSRTLGRLPYGARLTFIGLWTYCDNYGRGVDDPRMVKAAVWPIEDRETPAQVEKMLKALASAKLIVRYTGEDGERYLAIRNWTEHQRVTHPGKPKYPAPPEISGNVPEASGSVPEGSGILPRRSGSREQGAGSREQENDTALNNNGGNWPARASGMFGETIGPISPARCGAALKVGVDQFGEEVVFRAVAYFLKHAPEKEKPQFITPEELGKRLPYWIKRSAPVKMYDDKGEATPEVVAIVGRRSA